MRRLSPFVSAQIVMGPAILWATRIYRRRSVMLFLSIKYMKGSTFEPNLMHKLVQFILTGKHCRSIIAHRENE